MSAPDAELVRRQIAQIEKVAGARQPAGTQPRPECSEIRRAP
ncbi:MAG: hypothetical protein ABSD56_13075 [Bryobacteraceae bacterium]